MVTVRTIELSRSEEIFNIIKSNCIGLCAINYSDPTLFAVPLTLYGEKSLTSAHFATSHAHGLPRAEAATAARSLSRGPRHCKATRRRQSCFLPSSRPHRRRPSPAPPQPPRPGPARPGAAEPRRHQCACAAAAPPQPPGNESAPGPSAEGAAWPAWSPPPPRLLPGPRPAARSARRARAPAAAPPRKRRRRRPAAHR